MTCISKYPFILLVLGGLAAPVGAENLLYTLEIPENRAVTYELELDVRHPGTLAIEADWSGGRPLALRLEAPDQAAPAARRHGPSPLRIETTVVPRPPTAGPWRLVIHALAGRGSGFGRLAIELPAEQAPPGVTGIAPAPRSPAPPPLPWMVPRVAPAGVPASWTRVVETTETFRALVLAEGGAPAPDACRWQMDLLAYLATQRDRLLDEGDHPGSLTRKLLLEIVGTVARVDELRSSRDPLLAGPAPAERLRRRAWERARRERLRGLERRLDQLLESVRRGHAPELRGEDWPARLVSCLTACQRHFEERVRLGEERASNRELTADQWPPLLAAAQALESLGRLGEDPG